MTMRMSCAELHALQGVAKPGARLQALGRLPAGTMNKTEAAYAQHLELRRLAGEVLWWRFEAIKLRLADSTFLTVDFAVLPASCVLELHDAKGGRGVFADDAKVKMKVAAEVFPFVFKVVFPRKARDGGGWDIEDVLHDKAVGSSIT